jgi:hypothetical protein
MGDDTGATKRGRHLGGQRLKIRYSEVCWRSDLLEFLSEEGKLERGECIKWTRMKKARGKETPPSHPSARIQSDFGWPAALGQSRNSVDCGDYRVDIKVGSGGHIDIPCVESLPY